MITSEIIADSLNPVGNRLTTYILEYPRYIHSELLTHRVFSKNAASSRAIPIEKMIQQIQDNPAMPTHWGKNQSGMQANEELDNTSALYERCNVLDSSGDCDFRGETFVPDNLTAKEKAKEIWLSARDSSIKYVNQLNKIGLHKQIANRILEPWFHIRIIMSGTEFENFFALRAHKDAHPDLQKLAYLMLDQYNASEPKKLKEGEWHIPFGDKFNIDKINLIIGEPLGQTYGQYLLETKIKIAIARCARISYLNYEGKDDYEADIKLCDRLFGSIPKHLSPTEHVAKALSTNEWSGNYKGFKQYRKFFKEENLTDSRVKKHI